MISLASPWLLLLLPLPLLVWRLLPPYRESTAALRFPFFRRIVDSAQVEARSGSLVQKRRPLQLIVAGLCWLLAVVAICRPEHLAAPVEITRSARDVVLAIDISGSMDTRDFAAPDGRMRQRLAAVRDVVRSFVAGRDGDRMALIVFGSRAYVQVPLTEDLDTIVELLQSTEVGMAGPHTALGDAIGLAIRTFEASDIDQRLLILLSDGSDTASRMSPVNAAEIAAQHNVEIYTVAVGDPDASGEARVDIEMLEQLASRSGGQYFFGSDEAALSKIYQRIDELAPREVDTLSFRPRRSLAYVPLGTAALAGTAGLVCMLALSRRKAVRG